MRRFGGHLKGRRRDSGTGPVLVERYPLLPPSERYFFAAAFLSAQRFFIAATIAALPAALSVPLGFDVFFSGAMTSAFAAAHLLRCPAAIARRPAALIFRLGGLAGSSVGAGSAALAGSAAWPLSKARSSGDLGVDLVFLRFKTVDCCFDDGVR
jgi:hypothetical protein